LSFVYLPNPGSGQIRIFMVTRLCAGGGSMDECH
jgi:hypothetical protein